VRAFTRVELTCSVQANELAFTTLRHDGWIELYALPAFAVLVVWMFWDHGTLFTRGTAVLAGFVLCASSLSSRLQGRQATLRVFGEEIVANGNLGRWFHTLIRIPVSNILTIHYSSGREGERSGIYVRHGWRHTCVLPRIDTAQGVEILAAIRETFPSVRVVTSDASCSLPQRVLTSLHLMRNRNENAPN
jgi:hypothetical protein